MIFKEFLCINIVIYLYNGAALGYFLTVLKIICTQPGEIVHGAPGGGRLPVILHVLWTSSSVQHTFICFKLPLMISNRQPLHEPKCLFARLKGLVEVRGLRAGCVNRLERGNYLEGGLWLMACKFA